MEAPQYQCLTHFNVPRSKVSKKIIESQNVVKNFKLLALRKKLRKRFQIISAIKTSIIETEIFEHTIIETLRTVLKISKILKILIPWNFLNFEFLKHISYARYY